MEYKIKALKVSSIRGYIVILEEYSLPEKYTTYRVHLHIPGIKQIFKDYPSTAISAADRYSNFNDDYKQILDTYADWVTEINNLDIDSDTISALEYPKYVDPDKGYIPNGYYLLRGTIDHDIEVTINNGTINCNNTYPTGYLIKNSVAFNPDLSVIKLTNFPDGTGGTGTVYLSQPFMSTGGSNSGILFFTAYTIAYRYRFVFRDVSGNLTRLELAAVESDFAN